MGPIIQNPHALKAGTGDSHSVRAAEGCLGMCPQVRENHSGLQMLTMCVHTSRQRPGKYLEGKALLGSERRSGGLLPKITLAAPVEGKDLGDCCRGQGRGEQPAMRTVLNSGLPERSWGPPKGPTTVRTAE